MMRFFFPHALLVPVTVVAAVLYLAGCFARVQVVLDPAAGDLAITTGFWTRHVRLTWIDRVEEVTRSSPRASCPVRACLRWRWPLWCRLRRVAGSCTTRRGSRI